MPITISIPALRNFGACAPRLRRAHAQLRRVRAKGPYSAADAKAAKVTFDDVIWAATVAAGENLDIKRRLLLWAADCAARVLHIYEEAGDDPAPRNAILAARRFARGETYHITRGIAAADAEAAARDARRTHETAWAAAWAASLAANGFYTTTATSASLAVGLLADATDVERTWQYDRLVLRLSDDEPADWPLPERNR